MAHFEIHFPEAVPIAIRSRMVVFNGGTRGGVTTLRAHAFVAVPTDDAIVMTIQVKEIRKGPYGSEAVMTVPKIAGGYGSLVSFTALLDRKFDFEGKRRSLFSVTCPDGVNAARGDAIFSDGSDVEASVSESCRVAKSKTARAR
jgi:hypothetical protein